MDIGIVGAGIAGLGAAVALSKAGHDVEVFERSSFKREIGAAILLTPNGNRVLREWGFDFDKAQPVDFKQFRLIDGRNLQVVIRDSFEEVEEEFGDRMCAYHRVDLHFGLRELAEKQGVKIRLGAEVAHVQPGERTVEMRNGDRVEKDLWVLADGCHSPFLKSITEEDIPTVHFGKSVYRWLAPFDKVKQHPDACKLWNNQGAGFCVFFSEKMFMVTYPCRGQELLNCALFHDSRSEELNKKDWNSDTTHENVLGFMEGMHEAVRNIPMTCDQLKVYTVTQRAPSTQIYRENMVCIGDNTHHMLPSHAQGGCAALEDAAALGVMFDTANFTNTAENLAKRLHLFQQLRLPRTATTQIASSISPLLTKEGLANKMAEIGNFFSGDAPEIPVGAQSWSEPLRRLFYEYDVFTEAQNALKHEDAGCLPEDWKWFGDVGGVANLVGTGSV